MNITEPTERTWRTVDASLYNWKLSSSLEDTGEGMVKECSMAEETTPGGKCETSEVDASSNPQSSSPSQIFLDDFTPLSVLGRGAYAKVLLVRHNATFQLYAMKVLRKACVKDIEHVRAERNILKQVRSPFIVKLWAAFQTPGADGNLYLLMEYASGGELLKYMEREGKFKEPVAAFYTAELTLAIDYLHARGVIYRDLKPENCLLDAEGHILLTDFGLSKMSIRGGSEEPRATSLCGTTEYIAPEMFLTINYGCSVDWWSLGILLYDMLTGSPPFVSNDYKGTVEAILNNTLHLPDHLSPEAKDLLTKILNKNPDERIGCSSDGTVPIQSHSFFRNIDWSALESRSAVPPIRPCITQPELAENFDALAHIDTTHSSSTSISSPRSGPSAWRRSSDWLSNRSEYEHGRSELDASSCEARGRKDDTGDNMDLREKRRLTLGMIEGFNYVAKEWHPEHEKIPI
ncbi:uncharacterized protein VTP21DRAFT_6580 [Calcarisporiella thermophila]|uniref:uncharacterized protein n=1 Tax=Calcarisporiella thermophila TaxID=911321 RepID=UPI0037426219